MNLKIKMELHNVNTISYNRRRKKFDIFLETKIDWAFMSNVDLGWILRKLYANCSQRITIPRFMLLSYPYKVKVVISDLFS